MLAFIAHAGSEMKTFSFDCISRVFVFVFKEEDSLFDVFTFIAWDVGEHLY